MDGHGAGAIECEELDARASLIHGRPLCPRWREGIDGCAATVFVGQHAMAGDEAACREFAALVAGGMTAVVKRGLGRDSAVSLAPREARRRIRGGAREALERHRYA